MMHDSPSILAAKHRDGDPIATNPGLDLRPGDPADQYASASASIDRHRPAG
jgi:hypothetical protein